MTEWASHFNTILGYEGSLDAQSITPVSACFDGESTALTRYGEIQMRNVMTGDELSFFIFRQLTQNQTICSECSVLNAAMPMHVSRLLQK